MRNHFFTFLAQLVIRRRRQVLLWSFLLTAVSLYLAKDLDLRLGFSTQIDPNSVERRQLDYATNNFGGMDFLFITVTGPAPAAARTCAERLKPELERISEFINLVQVKIDLRQVKQHGLLFLKPDDLGDLVSGIAEQPRSFRRLFTSGTLPGFLGNFSALIEEGILEREEIGRPAGEITQLQGLAGFYDELLRFAREGEGRSPDDARAAVRRLFFRGEKSRDDEVTIAELRDEIYFDSPDGRTVLVLARPAAAEYDYSYSTRMMSAVDAALDRVRPACPGVTLGTTGNMSVMRDENLSMKRDMNLCTVLSFSFMLIIFVFFFRRPIYIVIVGLPLLMGLAWTLGFAYLTIGYFNTITSIFGAILMGLGIDFAIQLVSRYQEERWHARPVEEALTMALCKTGPAILTGGLTTSAAFFMLGVARFRGLSQMGFIAGSGLLFSLAAMLLVVPVLLLYFHRQAEDRRGVEKDGFAFLATVAGWVTRHPAIVVAAAAAISAVMAVATSANTFFYDFRALEPAGMPSIEEMTRVEKRFQQSIDYGIIIARNVEEDRRLAAALRRQSTIKKVDAISNYLPPDQAKKLPLVRRLEAALGRVEIPATPAPLTAAQLPAVLLQAEKLRGRVLAVKQVAVVAGELEVEDEAQRTLDRTRESLAALAAVPPGQAAAGLRLFQNALWLELDRLARDLNVMVTTAGLTLENLPPDLRRMYQGRDGNFIIYGYPTANIWNRPYMDRMVTELNTVQELATEEGGAKKRPFESALGLAVIFKKMIDDLLNDFQSASILSLLVIVLLLWLDFRSILYTVLSLIPLLLGTLWMVGVMPLVGWQFNFINVAIVPMILGMGIDYGVHIVHRYRSEGERGVAKAVRFTGRGVSLSALTTMAGFGAVAFVSHVGLSSLGKILFAGIGFCCLMAVVVLPALLGTLERLRDRRTKGRG